jgi:hypothetical protein
LGLLTTKKAAKILADGLGWAVTAGDVEDAVARGRLRAEKGPGRRSPCLVPEEEVSRLLEEDRQKKAIQAENGTSSAAEEKVADAWSVIPKQGTDYLFGLNWRPRRRGWR